MSVPGPGAAVPPISPLRPGDYEGVVESALEEDLRAAGRLDPARDLTTAAVIPVDSRSRARVVARSPGVVAGLDVAAAVFARLDPGVHFDPRLPDGAVVAPGDTVALVTGPTRALLTGERTALNLLGRASGVATITREFADAVEGTGARITDTRKTMPGLRALDKYAVRVGGGVNHRFGLYDAVMIKDNHIAAAGSLGAAVRHARASVGDAVTIVVEVDTLEQLREAIATSADRVLLDNMDPSVLRAAVELVDGQMETEASGGVTLDTVPSIAATGVDYVSVGALTHSAPQLDFGLDFEVASPVDTET